MACLIKLGFDLATLSFAIFDFKIFNVRRTREKNSSLVNPKAVEVVSLASHRSRQCVLKFYEKIYDQNIVILNTRVYTKNTATIQSLLREMWQQLVIILTIREGAVLRYSRKRHQWFWGNYRHRLRINRLEDELQYLHDYIIHNTNETHYEYSAFFNKLRNAGAMFPISHGTQSIIVE